MENKMINYLQEMLTKFNAMLAKNQETPGYYRESEINRMFDSMIACKEMVEAMINQPVNLRKDGKVTVGF